MLGMNRSYLSTEGQTTDGKYFGFELGYDKPTNKSGRNFLNTVQYNGNITGMVWKSDGDDIRRKYEFGYDAANRFMNGDFEQQNADDHLWNNTQVNYNMKMGDGISTTSAYDANGNILQMQQWGLNINQSVQIDNLKYTYLQNTNKLKSVTDFSNDPISKLGDFKTNATHPQAATKAGLTAGSTPAQFDAITDYTYDTNGNLNLDNNKAIGTIAYNHLNLPQSITVTGKGTITYTYDAGGNKLQKITAETPTAANGNKTITTTTTYLSGLVYESKTTSPANTPNDDYTDRLQFIPHEEGRIRFNVLNNTLQYDYMLKDHLGNVRMVLTEEAQQDKYPVASMEDAKLSIEQQYYTIDNSRIVLKTAATGLAAYTNDNGIGNNPSDPTFEAGRARRGSERPARCSASCSMRLDAGCHRLIREEHAAVSIATTSRAVLRASGLIASRRGLSRPCCCRVLLDCCRA